MTDLVSLLEQAEQISFTQTRPRVTVRIGGQTFVDVLFPLFPH